jgi:hypothetical protein
MGQFQSKYSSFKASCQGTLERKVFTVDYATWKLSAANISGFDSIKSHCDEMNELFHLEFVCRALGEKKYIV